MSFEAIKSIAETENQAKQLAADAKSKAAAALTAAGKQAETERQNMISDAEKVNAKLLEEARQRAAKRADELKQAEAEKNGMLKAKAKDRIEAAAQLIVERIVNG